MLNLRKFWIVRLLALVLVLSLTALWAGAVTLESGVTPRYLYENHRSQWMSFIDYRESTYLQYYGFLLSSRDVNINKANVVAALNAAISNLFSVDDAFYGALAGIVHEAIGATLDLYSKVRTATELAKIAQDLVNAFVSQAQQFMAIVMADNEFDSNAYSKFGALALKDMFAQFKGAPLTGGLAKDLENEYFYVAYNPHWSWEQRSQKLLEVMKTQKEKIDLSLYHVKSTYPRNIENWAHGKVKDYLLKVFKGMETFLEHEQTHVNGMIAALQGKTRAGGIQLESFTSHGYLTSGWYWLRFDGARADWVFKDIDKSKVGSHIKVTFKLLVVTTYGGTPTYTKIESSDLQFRIYHDQPKTIYIAKKWITDDGKLSIYVKWLGVDENGDGYAEHIGVNSQSVTVSY